MHPHDAEQAGARFAKADRAAREALLKEGQTCLADRAVHGVLFQLPQVGVYKAEVRGFRPARAVLFRRTVGFVATLLEVSVVVFAVMNILPGDTAPTSWGRTRPRMRWPRCASSWA